MYGCIIYHINPSPLPLSLNTIEIFLTADLKWCLLMLHMSLLMLHTLCRSSVSLSLSNVQAQALAIFLASSPFNTLAAVGKTTSTYGTLGVLIILWLQERSYTFHMGNQYSTLSLVQHSNYWLHIHLRETCSSNFSWFQITVNGSPGITLLYEDWSVILYTSSVQYSLTPHLYGHHIGHILSPLSLNNMAALQRTYRLIISLRLSCL